MKSFLAATCVWTLLIRAKTEARVNSGHHVQNVLDSLERAEFSKKTISTDPDPTEFMYNDAVVDHYAASLGSTPKKWSQRFYYDDTFIKADNSPVFLYIGGEGAQGPMSDRMFMYELASEVGALVVTLEHRYYGKSFPVDNMSVENLKFLTSEQAQADLARMIDFVAALPVGEVELKAQPALVNKFDLSASRWVAFGGSYPGNMATWLKLKYPSKVVGTVGSSAPVKADYNYFKYAQVTGYAMSYPPIGGSQQCYDIIEAAMTSVHDAVTNNPDSLPPSLSPCAPVKGAEDMYAYESEIFGWFQGTVQYNMQGPSIATVASLCSALTSASSTPIEALASMADDYFGGSCVPSSWSDLIDELRVEEFDGSSAMRQWIYQSCNEFGYFQTTEGSDHPFVPLKGVTLDAAGKKMCEAAYSLDAYAGPRKGGGGDETYASDEHYGARDIQGTNITMPNGSCDPWHSLGVISEEGKFYDEDQNTAEGIVPGESHSVSARLLENESASNY